MLEWSYRRSVSRLAYSMRTQKTSRPNAKHVLSPADRELMEQYGTAVVECSWVRIKEVPWSRIGGQCERLRKNTSHNYVITTNLPSAISCRC